MGRLKRQSGFTLIELLLVIGILGILSVIGLSTFSSAIVRGKDARRKNDLAQLAKALEAYMNDFGVYPDDNNGAIVGCSADGSVVLQDCPLASSGRFQRGKQIGGDVERIIYLDSYPEDPDPENMYYYINTTSAGNPGFALYAALENLDDKDVRRIGQDPYPDGWTEDGADCGSICNYKLTETGIVTESSLMN